MLRSVPPDFQPTPLCFPLRSHVLLIGKHIVDFLLVLIELFSLGVTTEALRANMGSK